MVQLAIHPVLTLVVHLEYYPGSRPPPEGSLIFMRTTSLGITAIAYQLRIFFSRTLMFLRQAYNRYERSLPLCSIQSSDSTTVLIITQM